MKKTFLFFCALVCLLLSTSQHQAQTLGWTEIQNTKIGATCTTTGAPQPPTCVAINYPQSRAVVTAWGGGVMDTIRNRMIVWGGGHGDYSGNELYAVDFDGIPAPLRLTNNTNPSSCSMASCDGGVTPNARHTYNNMDYSPANDILFVYSGGLAGFGNWVRDAWAFNFSTSTWEYKNSDGPLIPQAAQVSVDYDPITNKFWLCDGKSIYTYDYPTNTFTPLYVSVNGFVGEPGGVIDPVRRKLFIFDVSSAATKWVVDMTGAGGYVPTQITLTGASSGFYASPGMAYDPASGDIVGWGGYNSPPAEVYRLNTATYVVTAVSYSGGPGAPQLNGTYGRWQYSPSLGAFVVINSFDQNAFTFRLSGGTPPPVDSIPPTLPINLTAIPASTSQINLSWTPSTDNFGVTGYRVERCQGAGCSTFVQVGTPVSPSHSDAGLTASTAYSYRVRAADAAGNLSPYSSTANATTSPAAPTGPLTVGPGKQYATLTAAVAAATTNGSIIEADPIVFPEAVTLPLNISMTIRGVGGRAHLKWATGDHQTHASMIPNGKGLIVTNGGNVTLENIECSGAKVADGNGSCVRYQGGNLTLKNVEAHDSESGILGQGGLADTVTIEYSNFYRNGTCASGSCAHNVYIGTMGRFIFRHSKSTDSRDGHTFKSRAHINEILYSFISTKNSNGSLEIDLPNGGTAYVVGSVIEQGANTDNSSIVAWGAEGATNPNPALHLSGNTLYNWRTSGATFVQVSGSPTLGIKNNIWAGGGTPLVGGSTDLTSNLALTSAAFVNAAAGDFHLASGAAAINAGVAPGTAGTYSLNPIWEYVEPSGKSTRPVVGTIDVGAYESSFTPPPTGDTTPPVVAFKTANNASFASNAKLIEFTVSDNIGATSCEPTVNGIKVQATPVFTAGAKLPLTVKFYLQQAAIPKATYILGVSCKDAAGNTGTATPISVIRN